MIVAPQFEFSLLPIEFQQPRTKINCLLDLSLSLANIDKNKFDNLKTLGETIRQSREEKKLLLRELAAAIHVDTAMVSKFEKGERNPTRDQIISLSKALDIDEKVLLVIYFSDKIAAFLKGEQVGHAALKMAEKKITETSKQKNQGL